MGKEKIKRIILIIIYTILQCSWGILQNTFGAFVFLVLTLKNPRRTYETYHGAIVAYWEKTYSMSAGMFIFYGHEGSPDGRTVLVHEYGHSLQSALLGPLFVLIIGIPSYVWAFTPRFIRRRRYGQCTYLDFYPEKWANNWGEIVTKEEAPTR